MTAVLDRGLTTAEVRQQVAAGQVNTPPAAPGRTIGQILRANVLRFNAILGALFVLVMIVGPPQDALFGVVLVVNTAIGTAQELRARRALEQAGHRDRGARAGAARRHGQRDPQGEVVLDDLLDLRRGDQVPVDAAVLQAEG